MLKELRTQHRTIIQMVFSGFTNNEIAERLEMSPSSVSAIIRSPLGQAYLEGLNDKAQEDTLDVRKKLTSLNKSALATFERLLDPRQKAPHAVQATIAKDVLDRNGYKPPDKLNVNLALATKTDAEIDAEINALEDSIKKTRLQDPIKQIEESPQDLTTLTNDTVIPTIIESQKEQKQSEDNELFDLDLTKLCDDSDFVLDEELLNKIPSDVFDSSSKAS
jgi:DNA-binding MarR family transcriptional regulator